MLHNAFNAKQSGKQALKVMNRCQGNYLDGAVAVGCEVLSDDANDESSPEADCHAEEHVPVLHNAVRLSREDVRELRGQCEPRDRKHHLHVSDESLSVLRERLLEIFQAPVPFLASTCKSKDSTLSAKS